MGFLSRLFKGEKADRSILNSDAQYVQVTTACGERLIEIINESLHLANDSKNVDTKVSRLDVAKDKLAELKDLVSENSFLKITGLEKFEVCVKELESEFNVAGYREIAQGNYNGELLEKEGKVDEAIATYEKLLEAGVDTPFTYRRLAILYKKQKKIGDELRVLKAALKNVPSSNNKHYEWFADRLKKRVAT
jgi:tetratricopeptide (TPR) repeat protein